MQAGVHEARGAKIDEADGAGVGLGDEDVFWFEIAVDKATSGGEIKSSEELAGVLLDEEHWSRSKVVRLEAVIEVEAVEIEHEDAVPSEHEGVTETNEHFIGRRVLLVIVVRVQVFEDVALDGCLLVKLLLVLDDLESNGAT